MDRAVRLVSPTKPDQAQGTELRPFSAYDEAPNVVLLGDPGAGKTYTFRESVARCGGRLLSARAFLNTPSAKFSDAALFIDGLDEKRAGRSDRDTVDLIVQKLFDIAPKKVRISCRVADWLGQSDLSALSPYFEQSGDPVVLLLSSLNADEQRVVLESKGLSAIEAYKFRLEAVERGLADFLGNPQNLIMLRQAVKDGRWPATRRELFEMSTRLMLNEFDENHARSGCGVYTGEELRAPAGAACAVRLISDVEAISLADHEELDGVPSYRGLKMIPPEKMIAALGRRVFAAGPVPESVDYAHRTTAEYLAGSWLADQVKEGTPLGRIQALMGIDGHPAAELRGVHAWLAVHLPQCSNQLIDADPYGVLAYGDAASLERSSCVHLIEALTALSRTDPGFHSETSQSAAIAALSRGDMINELRSVLRSDDAGSSVRQLVVQAIALAPPLPALEDGLVYAIGRTSSSYSERSVALEALVRLGSSGKIAAKQAFDQLGSDSNAIRLRAQMLYRLYGECFSPADISVLLNDMAASSGDRLTGVLYELSRTVPVTDIPAVLEMLPQVGPTVPVGHSGREIGRFIGQVLLRAWRELTYIEPPKALHWLRLRHSYLRENRVPDCDEFRLLLRGRHELLAKIADHFVETLIFDDESLFCLTRFRQITLWEVGPAELFARIMPRMARSSEGSEEQRFLFHAAVQTALCINGSAADNAIQSLYNLSENSRDLRGVLDSSLLCVLPDGYLARPMRDGGEQLDKNLIDRFDLEAGLVESGDHCGWLAWTAQVYLGMFPNSDLLEGPRERLVNALGKSRADVAVKGFIAALSRSDVPSLAKVTAMAAQHKLYGWWLALATGLIERFKLDQDLSGFSDDFIQAMFVLDFTNPAFEDHDGSSRRVIPNWKTTVMQERPDLAYSAYIALARARLSRADTSVDALYALMRDPAFRPDRAVTVIQLISDFPNADPAALDLLFEGFFTSTTEHGDFASLAERVLSQVDLLDERQRNKWLAAAYSARPNAYGSQIGAVAEKCPGIVFDLRDQFGYGTHGAQRAGALRLHQLEFLARLTAGHYPDASPPGDGWSGDTNEWDAADFVRKLINEISAMSSRLATEALNRLLVDPTLASYDRYIRHALANQIKRRREKEYDRPVWSSTVGSLLNAEPATVADLHALLLDQVRDLRIRIVNENTDIYKQFWNVDGYSRPRTPRPEESCRDTLVTLLRPLLAPKRVTIEPEGHMVSDKRADISVAMPGRKILVELKRDYHPDLWIACDQQLERFYVHDPEAKGFGIYGVFWFGHQRPSPLPTHPDRLKPPESALELEQMLRSRIPTDRRHRLAVIVIDVSQDSSGVSSASLRANERMRSRCLSRPRTSERANPRPPRRER